MRASWRRVRPVFKPRVDTIKSVFLIVGTLLLACALSPRLDGPLFAADDTVPAEGQQFYKDKIRPILVQNCYKCHTDDPLSHLARRLARRAAAGRQEGAGDCARATPKRAC